MYSAVCDYCQLCSQLLLLQPHPQSITALLPSAQHAASQSTCFVKRRRLTARVDDGMPLMLRVV